MAVVYKNANAAAAHHVETQRKCREVNAGVTRRAKANLAAADTTTRITPEGYFPAYISSDDNGTDHFTNLHAPNALALEFGHDPSGYFADTATKPPAATYILTEAAISGAIS